MCSFNGGGFLTLSFRESITETFDVTLSPVWILWCDQPHETFLAALLHGTICFSIFYRNEIWDFSQILIFGTLSGS